MRVAVLSGALRQRGLAERVKRPAAGKKNGPPDRKPKFRSEASWAFDRRPPAASEDGGDRPAPPRRDTPKRAYQDDRGGERRSPRRDSGSDGGDQRPAIFRGREQREPRGEQPFVAKKWDSQFERGGGGPPARGKPWMRKSEDSGEKDMFDVGALKAKPSLKFSDDLKSERGGGSYGRGGDRGGSGGGGGGRGSYVRGRDFDKEGRGGNRSLNRAGRGGGDRRDGGRDARGAGRGGDRPGRFQRRERFQDDDVGEPEERQVRPRIIKDGEPRPIKKMEFEGLEAGKRYGPRIPGRIPPKDTANLELLSAIRMRFEKPELTVYAVIRTVEADLRSAIKDELNDCYKYFGRLTWLIQKQGLAVTPELMWGCYLEAVKKQDVLHAAKLLPGSRETVAKLVEDVQKVVGSGLEHKDMPDHVRREWPEHMYNVLKKELGESELGKELDALKEDPFVIRVNVLKTTPEQVIKRFAKQNVKLVPGRFVPAALRVEGQHPRMDKTAEFSDGLIEIQSEASQLATLMTAVTPQTTNVLDFCCGAGGKTLALAALMQNRGKLVATDVDSSRLNRAKPRLERAGVTNSHRVQLTGQADDSFLATHRNHFERILVDPPTSGIGQWRLSAEGKWNDTIHAGLQVTELQSKPFV